ncbi:hypothetical protein M885DRAFT_525602 [Pelagophyceae sp. CCMP2097]|nr:hypothetical protein M885DRAFT_525602 [Pelagophyceae sp. CCMP2097]
MGARDAAESRAAVPPPPSPRPAAPAAAPWSLFAVCAPCRAAAPDFGRPAAPRRRPPRRRIEGFLMTLQRSTWRKRLFVVRHQTLSAYDGERLRGAVSLSGARLFDDDEPARHAFSVEAAGGARLALRCSTEAEKRRWLAALQAAVDAPETAVGVWARFADAARDAEASERVCGTVLKRGQAFWNRRALVLDCRRRTVEYVDALDARHSARRIDLCGASVVARDGLRFDVSDAAGVAFRFKALDTADSAKWVDAIAKTIEGREDPLAIARAFSGGGGAADAGEPANTARARACLFVAFSVALLVGPGLVARIAWLLFRCVFAPACVALANAWYFRAAILRCAWRYARRFGIEDLGPVPRLDAKLRRWNHVEVRLCGVAIRGGDDVREGDDLISFDALVVSAVLRCDEPLRLECAVDVDGLVINYVCFDARFRDTNVSRLLEDLRARGNTGETGDESDDDAAAAGDGRTRVETEAPAAVVEALEEPAAAPHEADASAAAAPRRGWRRRVVLKSAVVRRAEIRLKSAFGGVDVGRLVIEDETVVLSSLGSTVALVAWIHALVARSIVGLSFDAIDGLFDGVTGVATQAAFAPLDAIDHASEKLGGSRVLQGTTDAARASVRGPRQRPRAAQKGGAGSEGRAEERGHRVQGPRHVCLRDAARRQVRSIVGGIVDGSSNIVHGVGKGGKALAKGITSGTASGTAQGFYDAGSEITTGLLSGVATTAGGVVGGVRAVGGGVVGSARDVRLRAATATAAREARASAASR